MNSPAKVFNPSRSQIMTICTINKNTVQLSSISAMGSFVDTQQSTPPSVAHAILTRAPRFPPSPSYSTSTHGTRQLGSLDFDVESEDVVGDVVGLLRNHRYHADGSPSYVQDDGFAFAEPDTGSSNNKNTSSNNGSNSADRSVQKHVRPATGSLASFPGSAAPCFRATNTNISFLDPSQSFFLGGGAGSNCGGRGPVEPVGSSFAGTISGGLYETTGGMPSLRDLLLERGPPAPPVSNEFMLAESI